MFALPGGAGYEVLRRTGLPIIVIYPVAVMLVCRLFLDYEGWIHDRRTLEESRQRLLEAQRIARMGDFTWDVETGEITWSDALFELLGYDKTETVDYAKVNANIHHPDDLECVTRWLKDCIESGEDELMPNEYRLLRKDGETMYVRTVGVIQHRPGRKPVIFATIQDITERRKAEEALRESETKYRTLFEQIGNAVAVYQAENDGSDFIFVCFNRAAERIEQMSRKEIIGQSVLEVFPAVREFGLFDVFRRVWRTGRPERHPVALYKDERIEGWRDNFVYKLPTGEIVAVYTDETERKRAEQALQKSESFQKALIAASPVALYSIDSEGNVLSWNESAERIFGWKSHEVVGGLLPIVPEDKEEEFRKFRSRVMAGESFSHTELVRRRKDGTLFDCSLSSAPIYNDDGEVTAIMAALEDITERKKSEIALRESEERFREVFESANVGKSITSPTGRISVNRAFADMLGYTREELQDKTWQEITPSDEIDATQSELAPLLDGTRDSARFYKRYVHKNDKHVWADVNVTLRRDGEGKSLYFITTIVDVTDQKLMEQALRESESDARAANRRLRDLQEAISKLASARNMDDVTAIARAAARRLTKADGATFILRDGDCCSYVDEDAIAPLWKGRKFPMDTCVSGWVMRHDQAVVIEDVYSDPRVPADIYRPTFVKSLAMVPISAAETLGAIGAYWSERREAAEDEKQLLRALADAVAVTLENIRSYELLEQRVADRTAQLAAANKELEAFSYSVSHDLRAPLRAVDGYVRILLEDYSSHLDEEGRRVCSVISDSSREMGRLIDDLLAFSRVGRSAMRPSPVDMEQLARSIFYELTTPKDRERIDFRAHELPAVVADPALMRQVWMNLLSNAVKFSSKVERAAIEVTGREENGENIYSVRDNGAGFDMRYEDKLFGVFQRLHSARDFEGSGVGLAIVQRIISRHGGKVWAEGEPGKGAVFHFTMKGETRNE